MDSVHIASTNPVVVQKSFLHDNTHWLNDPAWNGGPSHDDNIQVVIGKNIRITDNTIYGAFNAALMISQDKGAVTDLVMSGNVIGGGGCSVNIAAKTYGPVYASFLNNKFNRDQRLKNCAITRGPSDVLTVTGNSWSDNGAVVAATDPRLTASIADRTGITRSRFGRRWSFRPPRESSRSG